ncbi:MAG: AAA family ATPase [Thermoguttaceae bacterium]
MKITIENLGALKQAEFTLGELTIICGANNTGKTYATHATYGLFDFLRKNLGVPIEEGVIKNLIENGFVSISLESYCEKLPKLFDKAVSRFSELLCDIFAGNEKNFSNSKIGFSFDLPKEFDPAGIRHGVSTGGKTIMQIQSSEDKKQLNVELSANDDNREILPEQIVRNSIEDAIRNWIVSKIIPKPFLASAERTGAAIFQSELDFTRNRLIELLGDKTTKFQPLQLLGKFGGKYPLAVRRNVDFIRDLPNITNRDSFIQKEHPEILNDFRDIIGGEYRVSKESGVQFVPTSKNVKLSLVESSSAVRSMLDVGFYLRHQAQRGDLLMIDEPELNLHPENQRRVARLFARLVNLGVKVFMTTHSDYIVKEFNTLIMLNQNDKRLKALAKREEYKQDELLNHEKVKVYIAEEALVKQNNAQRKTKCLTLTPADIDATSGIDARSFDKTIVEMNRIQDEIVWGDESDD